MATRGRPKQNGAQPGWMLVRALMVLQAFHKHRLNGIKQEVAVTMAADDANQLWPKNRIKESTVKTILAKLYPTDTENVVVVEEIESANSNSKSFGAGFKERPVLTRANKPKAKKIA
jgi:hypothetical protein